MNTEENYRPKTIEFDVAPDGTLMPDSLGDFKTAEEASKFVGGNFISASPSITVNRHMDHVEKKLLREQYEDVLENVLPVNEQRLRDMVSEASDAKKREKDAQETVNATMTEVKTLAQEVKRGLKQMILDENHTYKIAFKGRFYFYTYIDKELRMVKQQDIPEHEKGEIFADSATNEEFIEKTFPGGE